MTFFESGSKRMAKHVLENTAPPRHAPVAPELEAQVVWEPRVEASVDAKPVPLDLLALFQFSLFQFSSGNGG